MKKSDSIVMKPNNLQVYDSLLITIRCAISEEKAYLCRQIIQCNRYEQTLSDRHSEF